MDQPTLYPILFLLLLAAFLVMECAIFYFQMVNLTKGALKPSVFFKAARDRPRRFPNARRYNAISDKSLPIAYPMYLLGFVITLPFMLGVYSRWSDEDAREATRLELDGLVAEIVDYFKAEIAFDEYPTALKNAFVPIAEALARNSLTPTNADGIPIPEDTAAQVPQFPNAQARLAFLRERYNATDLVPFFGGVITEAFTRLSKGFPAFVEQPGVFTIPFLNLFEDAGPLNSFFHTFQRDDKLLWITFSIYTRNWYAAEAAVEAKFYPKNSLRYYQRIVEGTCLSSFAYSGGPEVQLVIPEHLRFEGTWIIAPPGRGKTTLLSSLLAHDLDSVAAGKASVILMDSKGDLIDHAKKLKDFAPGGRLQGRLVLIEPRPDLALNPLDLGSDAGHTISLLEYLFTALLDTAPTPLQSSLFRSVLLAMQAIPNSNFDTFRRFLMNGWQPYESYIRTMHPDDRDFFTNGEYDSKTYTETKQQLLWRIRDLTTKVPLIRDMFKAPHTLLDLSAEMDAGKVIIIDNSAAKLSSGSEFFARFFVALILAAAQQRAGRRADEKLPCYFYIDECDTVISRDLKIAEIIQRCRSQKIGLILAHQTLTQIDNEKVRAALADCAVRIANSDDEAAHLAPRLRTEVEVLRSLGKGKFAVFMRDQMKRALIVTVPPDSSVSGWPKMTESEFAAVQRKMQENYCFTTPCPETEPPPDPSPDSDLGTWA